MSISFRILLQKVFLKWKMIMHFELSLGMHRVVSKIAISQNIL